MITRLTACALVEKGGRYLLVEERANGRIVLNNPSGRWEPGEILVQTCIREAAEEAGISFEPRYVVGSYITLHTSNTGQRVCTVRFTFGGDVRPEQPTVAPDSSILGTHWLSYQEVVAEQARLRSSAILRGIDDARAGHKFPMHVINHMVDS